MATAAAVQNGINGKKAPAAGGWRFARGSKEQGGDRGHAEHPRRAVQDHGQRGGARPVLPLAHGDPSAFLAFRTAAEAEDAVAAALRTGDFNCYPPGVGLPAARRYVRLVIVVRYCLLSVPNCFLVLLSVPTPQRKKSISRSCSPLPRLRDWINTTSEKTNN
jgi:hypothetical protein